MTVPARATDAGPAQPEALRDVVARIEAELEAIARAIDANHARVAVEIGAGATTAPGLAQAMQEGDMLYQRVAGVAAFLRAIAAEMPHDWRLDTGVATRALGLADLARRIGGNAHPHPAPKDVDYGDCDLF